ncbi:MAG TPA: T9SS type A sorting domain-containing protein [Bacteroidia bacterium]|nr:T9SS type A sorting domain-containing protein [Bacteroidia bacterium]HNT80622.1 T9SS type A sorting domain-containing protein [Bacteroidia bacterium]
MKKILQSLMLITFCSLWMSADAQRYLTEIFPSSTVTSNVVYGSNLEVLTGTPISKDLKVDIYEPAGAVDPLAQRPLVIMWHTGSFLPPFINQTPTGSKTDSVMAEVCRQFARRGYVAAAATYRWGWNPQALGPQGQDIRTGTLLLAAYRGIQDAHACVRYFKANAAASNDYGIDANKIIMGGIGTGGYISLAYSTLDDSLEVTLPKFVSSVTDPTYGFVAGMPYVNMAAVGNIEGYGGIPQYNNPNNNPGVNSDVNFCFNMGGALGDSSWLGAGDAPMVAFHCLGDPFAPYADGPVIVPTTGDFVVDVSGSFTAIKNATLLGNNASFNTAGFTDPYTLRANMLNQGYDGLFPFETFPPVQSAPWEWFDSTYTVLGAQSVGLSAAQGAGIYSNALLTNPNMSKAKALAYVDTVMNYLNPRIVTSLGLSTGINELDSKIPVQLYPNPVSQGQSIFINSEIQGNLISAIEVMNIQGQRISYTDQLNQQKLELKQNHLANGMYLIKVYTLRGNTIHRISVH